jgi:hypothetical protein
MLLKPNCTIRLDILGTALLSFVDIQYLDLPSTDQTLEEDAPDSFAYAVRSFGRHIYDNSDCEEEIRRALAYMLNLSDQNFALLVRQLRVPYPRFDPPGVRRLLEKIWTQYFVSWKYDDTFPQPEWEYLSIEWGDGE